MPEHVKDEFDDPARNPSNDSVDLIHLPTLISNEFGISRSMAREQIMLGMVLIDGEQWDGDRIDIPMAELTGREITVRGRNRSFRMNYGG